MLRRVASRPFRASAESAGGTRGKPTLSQPAVASAAAAPAVPGGLLRRRGLQPGEGGLVVGDGELERSGAELVTGALGFLGLLPRLGEGGVVVIGRLGVDLLELHRRLLGAERHPQ